MTPMGGAGGLPGMPGMPGALSGASLLGREVSPAPSSPVTQPLQALGTPPLSLGGAFGHDSSSVAPLPAGRSIASLRAPRGTNFIRLAFAAIFLLGFLGLVGFLLKDYLPGMFPGLLGSEVAEETSKEDPSLTGQSHLLSSPAPGTSSAFSDNAGADKSAPQPSSAASAASAPKPAPIVVGFDPTEPSAPKSESASPAPMTAASLSEKSALPADTPPSPPAAGALLEVPAKPAMNAESSGAQTTSPASLTQSHVIEEDDAPPAAKPAVEALKKFLSAKSLTERLAYTLGADVMKPLMERYYGRAPDGPILVDRIQFVRMDPNPELGSGKHCIFSLENKTWEFSVPVMLEEKPDGFKVDWVSFVEFKDRLLEKFFQTYQEGEPCFFHVGILRSHYFKDDVPNLEHKDVFRVSPAPPNSFQETAFLDKNSELAQKLRSQLPWETHVWAVVGLQWKKLGSQQWVELTSVPQMHWYSLPMAPHSISTPQKAAEAEELPPGITKNGVRSKSGGSSSNMPPPGIRKSTPDLPPTIKRPLPAGR